MIAIGEIMVGGTTIVGIMTAETMIAEIMTAVTGAKIPTLVVLIRHSSIFWLLPALFDLGTLNPMVMPLTTVEIIMTVETLMIAIIETG